MARARVKIESSRSAFIHNDLANAAYYYSKRISERLAKNDEDGIALEIMAGLILTAFALEANFNYIGHLKVAGWKERQPYERKITDVFAALAIKPDFNQRPFSSISRL